MKKMVIIVTMCVSLGVTAQVPVPKDSLVNPEITDSSDFSNSSYSQDSTKYPAQNYPIKEDSLPMDDRKPKRNPKK